MDPRMDGSKCVWIQGSVDPSVDGCKGGWTRVRVRLGLGLDLVRVSGFDRPSAPSNLGSINADTS